MKKNANNIDRRLGKKTFFNINIKFIGESLLLISCLLRKIKNIVCGDFSLLALEVREGKTQKEKKMVLPLKMYSPSKTNVTFNQVGRFLQRDIKRKKMICFLLFIVTMVLCRFTAGITAFSLESEGFYGVNENSMISEKGTLKTYKTLDEMNQEETVQISNAGTTLPSELTTNYVDDEAKALSEATITYIEGKNAKRRQGRSHLYVKIAKEESEYNDLADATKEEFKNQGLTASDMMLLIVPEKGYDLYQGDGIIAVITDQVLKDVLDTEMKKDFEKGQIDKGVYDSAKRLFKLTKKIDMNYLEDKVNKGNEEAKKGETVFGQIVLLLLIVIFISTIKNRKRET